MVASEYTMTPSVLAGYRRLVERLVLEAYPELVGSSRGRGALQHASTFGLTDLDEDLSLTDEGTR